MSDDEWVPPKPSRVEFDRMAWVYSSAKTGHREVLDPRSREGKASKNRKLRMFSQKMSSLMSMWTALTRLGDRANSLTRQRKLVLSFARTLGQVQGLIAAVTNSNRILDGRWDELHWQCSHVRNLVAEYFGKIGYNSQYRRQHPRIRANIMGELLKMVAVWKRLENDIFPAHFKW